MRYRITQVKISPGQGRDVIETAIRKKVAKALKYPADKIAISNMEIVKESVDARKKPDVKMVYTVDFDYDGELPFEEAVTRTYEPAVPAGFFKGRTTAASRPVIVGFGPCGMFASLVLAEAGLAPLVIERGKKAEDRVEDVRAFHDGTVQYPDPESNVQFGEGGAGTFSDGKLTTGIRDVRIRKVLEEFVRAGADREILYRQKPHIGTDRLQLIVREIRKRIEELGGEIRFSRKLEGITTQRSEDGTEKLTAINVLDNLTGNTEVLETDKMILASGHSARDTFKMLLDSGVKMEKKPFSIGVRVQHPQKMINEVQYGDAAFADIIGAADYKLSCKCENGRGVYTFCMCPGGEIINASTERETQVTNGMSNSARDGKYANSGLLVDVRTSDVGEGPLAGVEFQRKYERLAWENKAVSTYGMFRKNDKDPVRMSLPAFASKSILEAMPKFGKKLKGFDRDDTKMVAVESRSSSPVRIKRDEKMKSSISGIIPAGEGSGYAGGIMSAAVDGIRAAERIIRDIVEEGEEWTEIQTVV